MAAVMTRANRQYIFAFSCTHVLILLPIQSRVQSLLASSKSLEDSVAFAASVSVRFWRKERGTSLARPKPRIPFLGLCLLRNQTETLATQAMKTLVQDCFLLPSKCQFLIREKNTNHSSAHLTCIFNVFIFDLKEWYKIVFPKLYH